MSVQFDFDNIPPCRNRSSLKWDAADRFFGGKDLLPLWIADMDFPAAPGIVEQLHQRADTQWFGYGMLSPEYYQTVISWMEHRHNARIEREWVLFTPGVVPALHFAVQTVCKLGDEVLVPSPVYGPFYKAVESQGCTAVPCPLAHDGLRYSFDFEEMERRITPATKALMLCSPHNPVGRVWTADELAQTARFCIEHNLVAIVDEIHHDLVFKQHTFYLNAAPEIADRCIVCTAPSKTFNIAGIQAANTIIPGEKLRVAYRKTMARNHAFSANSFVEAAVVGAYGHSEAWLDALLPYLKGNIDLFCSVIDADFPALKVRAPEGTYLVWIDCRSLGKTNDELKAFFADRCGLALNAGGEYGLEGEGFARVNMACTRATVQECLNRLGRGCR